MAAESVEAIAADLWLSSVPQLADTRRNIFLRGVDVDALRGATFSLDSGDGPVTFLANRPANPCAWMDEMLAPGAFTALRKQGGMRCTPLSSGTLRVGPATFRSSVPAARV
jgi:MOSC domain-containing protein YiiM